MASVHNFNINISARVVKMHASHGNVGQAAVIGYVLEGVPEEFGRIVGLGVWRANYADVVPGPRENGEEFCQMFNAGKIALAVGYRRALEELALRYEEQGHKISHMLACSVCGDLYPKPPDSMVGWLECGICGST